MNRQVVIGRKHIVFPFCYKSFPSRVVSNTFFYPGLLFQRPILVLIISFQFFSYVCAQNLLHKCSTGLNAKVTFWKHRQHMYWMTQTQIQPWHFIHGLFPQRLTKKLHKNETIRCLHLQQHVTHAGRYKVPFMRWDIRELYSAFCRISS